MKLFITLSLTKIDLVLFNNNFFALLYFLPMFSSKVNFKTFFLFNVILEKNVK